MAMLLLSVFAVGGVLVALAGNVEGGGHDPTCKSQLEETSFMQLAFDVKTRQRHHPQWKKSFAQSSKPFLGNLQVGALSGEEEHGRLLINEDGVMNTYYLPGAPTTDDGRTVKFEPPWRYYLMKTPTTNYSDAEDFYKPMFLGKTFAVDIDFRGDGPSCGCNLNFYLVDMPVELPGKDEDYYCDAQCFEGLGCCAEFDMNEGNMNVQQVTNHACTDDYGEEHPDWVCSKWGDPINKTRGRDFGAGAEYTIDSRRVFTYAQSFEVEESGDFTFTTTISQEGREVVLRIGPGSRQLNAMLEVLERGMAFVTGYWFQKDMNWMDGETCGQGPEHCNRHPAFISNWRLTSNNAK